MSPPHTPPAALVGYRTVADGTVSAAAVVRSVKRYGTLADASAASATDGAGHVILYGGDHDRVTLDNDKGAFHMTDRSAAVVTADPEGSVRIAYVPSLPL